MATAVMEHAGTGVRQLAHTTRFSPSQISAISGAKPFAPDLQSRLDRMGYDRFRVIAQHLEVSPYWMATGNKFDLSSSSMVQQPAWCVTAEHQMILVRDALRTFNECQRGVELFGLADGTRALCPSDLGKDATAWSCALDRLRDWAFIVEFKKCTTRSQEAHQGDVDQYVEKIVHLYHVAGSLRELLPHIHPALQWVEGV